MGELRFDAGHVARGVRARFTVAAGETLAIVGANGAGKSTSVPAISPSAAPVSCPGDRRSGWPSHVPWRPNPSWCCSTNR
ncbi:molybdenum ABC transporter, ATP-binding protein [Mycobacteroides abscessus subsp. abscessus]|nr:molybdenum ABC transporter, ATP-binding protein [Mycobacteroides abscessus subsp. abscessus]